MKNKATWSQSFIINTHHWLVGLVGCSI
uniref:Uncharacterized protein n=1 Tax=Anguilla anguilla TaxID=7936 RepID=A0A0E9RDW5_ANGAN